VCYISATICTLTTARSSVNHVTLYNTSLDIRNENCVLADYATLDTLDGDCLVLSRCCDEYSLTAGIVDILVTSVLR
jgi:hypothetical protein